jgi:hypothetical protein
MSSSDRPIPENELLVERVRARGFRVPNLNSGGPRDWNRSHYVCRVGTTDPAPAQPWLLGEIPILGIH